MARIPLRLVGPHGTPLVAQERHCHEALPGPPEGHHGLGIQGPNRRLGTVY